MNLNKLIHKFNTRETVLIISDYPEKTLYGEKNYGIAWHTKRLIEPLATDGKHRFVILAEKGMHGNPELYGDGNILVLRVFDPKHHAIFPTVLRWLLRFDQIHNVHVHSEFCANGGVWNQALIAPFLLLIKLAQRRVTYYAHNVVTDLKGISKHLNMQKNSLSYNLVNAGIKVYYQVINVLVDRWIVMDEAIQVRLQLFVPVHKILLLPFFLQEKKSALSQVQARKKLGIPSGKKVLLSFGFVTYYKGADWIIRTFLKLKKHGELHNFQLILAGGEAHSLKSKSFYRNYYKKVQVIAQSEKDVMLTGFVPESDIDLYFAAADLVILPYRGLIGSSATLTKAIEYKKPFILSRHMKSVLESHDILPLFENLGVSKQSLYFEYNSKGLLVAIKNIMKPQVYDSVLLLEKALMKVRSKSTLTQKYLRELDKTSARINQWQFYLRKFIYAR
ncbi:glycosyltransferase [Candidatus Woesebacteria bacterium]|nr:glycosyltransferase [Candidatus Woesebacteria bacterium]